MKKIQLKFESVSTKVLNLYIRLILKWLSLKKIVTTVVYLPKVIKRISFLKSPHVFKKSKEHFELKKKKVLLTFYYDLFNFKVLLLNRPNTVKVKLISIK